MSEVIDTDHSATILGWVAGMLIAGACFAAGYIIGGM